MLVRDRGMVVLVGVAGQLVLKIASVPQVVWTCPGFPYASCLLGSLLLAAMGSLASYSTGRSEPSDECRLVRLYTASIHQNTSMRASARVRQCRRSISSHSKLAKKALAGGVVQTVTDRAHRRAHAQRPQPAAERQRGELATVDALLFVKRPGSAWLPDLPA
jgi:hypothetical protein